MLSKERAGNIYRWILWTEVRHVLGGLEKDNTNFITLLRMAYDLKLINYSGTLSFNIFGLQGTVKIEIPDTRLLCITQCLKRSLILTGWALVENEHKFLLHICYSESVEKQKS